jgi:PAS domain S-box-containing protein
MARNALKNQYVISQQHPDPLERFGGTEQSWPMGSGATPTEVRTVDAGVIPPSDVQTRAVFEHPALYTLILAAVRDELGQVIDWVYRDANANALRMTGQTREQLVGRRVSETVPERAPRIANACARVLASGMLETYDAEFHGRIFSITIYPAGKDAVISSALDITGRKRAEVALRESGERFRELANSIDQFAWTCDPAGTVTWYNQRWYEYTGTSFEQMQNEGWKAVMHPEHYDRVIAHLQRCLANGKEWEDTFPLRGSHGHYRWFLSRAVPVRNTFGKIVRWIGTNTDITESRQLQVALEQADRRKDEFLAMLAHELRNPLTPISNAAEALLQIVAPERSQERLLIDMVRRQAGQLARLIDDLLDVARITQGRIELRMQQVVVGSCIEAAVEMVEPLVQARGQRLLLAPPLETLYVRGDGERLGQCISNLLVNAVKYTNPGGEIRVRYYSQADHAVIEIVDTGVGISPELLPHIFELFVQGDRTLDRSQGGLGVGLAICKQLIEMHQGTITAHSEGVGRGAKFEIRLPLAEACTETDSSAPSQLERTRRVLIVDDNQDAADSLAMVLRFEGHTTTVAYSAQAAIETVQSYRPEFVLLDIGLPNMDGYEVARRIQASGSTARIIALTGYGQAEDRQRSTAAGFTAHLVKPVDLAILRSVLAAEGPPVPGATPVDRRR